MPKTTTKYEIRNGDEVLETKAKKAQALERGQELAKELKATLEVFTTPAGNHVATFKARKPQTKTVPYTRTVDLPEGAIIPEGFRVAYTRNRKDLAIIHKVDAENGPYNVVNFVTGEVLAEELPTTRASGAFCSTVPKRVKEEAPASA